MGTINGTNAVAKKAEARVIGDSSGNGSFIHRELNLGFIEHIYRKKYKQAPEISDTNSDKMK